MLGDRLLALRADIGDTAENVHGLCRRIEVHAHRSFVIGMDRHELQTQFPPSRIELWNASQFRLPSFHSASTTAAAANPSATPINGLSTANQKEMFQSEFSGVGFLFITLSQVFEDQHFTKRQCERYETENFNKHRQGKQRSDLAELILNVMRSQDDEVTCNVSREEPAERKEADNIRRAGCCAKHG
jgi:hypothetical protein